MQKHTFLMADKAEQRVRVEEKRTKILNFLATEGFSSTELLSEVLGMQGHGAHTCLKALERDLYVRCERLPTGARLLTIWGLTPHGVGMMADFENGQVVNYFEPSRVSPWTIQHSLAVQKLRLQLEAKGWTGWRSDRQCRAEAVEGKWLKVPDALAVNPQGELVAIEVERTVKTLKLYPEIMAAYLQMARAGRLLKVNYFCCAPLSADRMQNIFSSIHTIKINGQAVPLSQQHHRLFEFFNF